MDPIPLSWDTTGLLATIYWLIVFWAVSHFTHLNGPRFLVPPSSSPQPTDSSPPVDSICNAPPNFSQCKALPITIISAPTFTLACCLQGSVQFSLQIATKESELQSPLTASESLHLLEIPLDYHEFANFFSKSKANMLAPHPKHDLKIELKEGASPPLGTIYSLFLSELEFPSYTPQWTPCYGIYHPPRRMISSIFALIPKDWTDLQRKTDIHFLKPPTF